MPELWPEASAPLTFAPLRPAPTIRVVHPSGGLRPAEVAAVARGVEVLRASGRFGAVRHDPLPPPQRQGAYLASDDELRLAELVDAIDDDEVDLIWAARGGSGAARIAPQVLAHLGQVAHLRRPKVLVGFSDITTLLCCWVRMGWPAVHGPVVKSLGPNSPVQVDLATLWAVVTGATDRLTFRPTPGATLAGRLVGGNLTVLASLAGTPLLPQGPGLIWVLEDVKEPLYSTDRSLTQLRLARALSGAAGLWLGGFSDEREQAVSDAVAHLCRTDLGLPVVVGAPAGHQGLLQPLPFGVPVRLDPHAGTLSWRVDHDHA